MILMWLGGFFLAAGVAAQMAEPRPAGQAAAAPAAAAAGPQLHRGMSSQEVRAVLGEPDDLISRSGPGRPETWKYCRYPDCGKQLGFSAPTTELGFVNDRLQEWTTYKPSPEAPREPHKGEERQPARARGLPGS
ncbi:MAG: hypothetical protein M0P73_05790 [Syntrophobacterales bacterium]|jgi:hypothetical protein|nr:hypothetical protein [Syntrophobacterales bacterium]